MKSPRLVTGLALAAIALLLSLAAACGSDSDEPADRMVSELTDAEHISECNATRTEVTAQGVIGQANYSCFAASNVGGSCNMNIFENCVQLAVTACVAPGSNSPLKTCAATVSEMHACEVAFGAQYTAYFTSNCAMPPTSTAKKRTELSACATFCSKCAAACQ